MRFTTRLFLLSLTLILSACEGGGSSDESSNTGSDSSGSSDIYPLPSNGTINGVIDSNSINTGTPSARGLRSLRSLRTIDTPTLSAGAYISSTCGANDPNLESQDSEISASITEPMPLAVASDGSFSANVPACPNYSLIVIDADTGESINMTDIAVGEGDNVIIDPLFGVDLEEPGSITFSVLNSSTNEPLAETQVYIETLGLSGSTDADGHIYFADIPVGTYGITINNSQYSQKYVTASVESNVTTNLQTISLNSQKGKLTGQITAEGLDNYANIVVYAQSVDNSLFTAITNNNGTYTFNAVPVGEGYSVLAQANGFVPEKVDNIEVEQNASSLVSTINLKRAESNIGSISGYARFSNNNNMAFAGIIVSLEGTDKEAITARDGSYILPEIATGTYTLNFTESNHQTITQTASVIKGATTQLNNVYLAGFTGNISGTVTLEDNTPISNATVKLTPLGTTTTTDTNGQFSFSNINANDYNLEIFKSGYISLSKNITVIQEQDTQLEDLILVPRVLFATVTDGTDPIDSVVATLVGLNGTTTAISNAEGLITFSAVDTGNYQLQLAKSGYNGQLFQFVMPDTASYTLPFDIEMEKVTGVMIGSVTLDQQVNHAGINIQLNDTAYQASSDAVGNWQINLPIGNYAQGLRYSKQYYAPQDYTGTISINEFGQFTLPAVSLIQTSSLLSFNVSTQGTCEGDLTVQLEGTSPENEGYSVVLPVAEDGSVSAELPLGEYLMTTSCSTPGLETITQTIDVTAGTTNVELDDQVLRESYLSINQGDKYTNSQTISLSLGSSDAASMNISLKDGSLATGWVSFSSETTFTLDNKEGNKTVVANYLDVNGQPLPSVEDSIVLDTSINVTGFETSGATTKGDTLHLRLNLNNETEATVLASISGLFTDLVLLDNGAGGDSIANDGIYERDYIIHTPHEITGIASANIVDRATNQETVTASTSLSLVTAPSIENVSTSSSIATGEMSIKFSTDEPTTSQITYGNDASNQDKTQVISELLSTNHQITLTALNPNQEVWFTITAKDGAHNEGTYLGKEKLAPAVVDGLAAYPGDEEVGLIWNKVDSKSVVGYRLYRSEDQGTTFILMNNSTLITDNYYNDLAVENNKSYRYYVTAVDQDNNESQDSIIVNITPLATLAGPTLIDGGILQKNTVWLSSRSPYQLSNNLKVSAEVQLSLLPGTNVEFVFNQTSESKDDVNLQRYIQVAGILNGFGTQAQPITISEDGIHGYFEFESDGYCDPCVESKGTINFNYANLNNIGINGYGANKFVEFNYVTAQLKGYQSQPDSDWLQSINLDVDLASNSSFYELSGEMYTYENCYWDAEKQQHICTEVTQPQNYVQNNFNIQTAIDSNFEYKGEIDLNNLNTDPNDYYNQAGIHINVTTASATQPGRGIISGGFGNLTTADNMVISLSNLNVNELTNSQISTTNLNGGMTLHFNQFDSTSTLNKNNSAGSDTLDLGSNYWGSVDLNDILARTNYRSGENNLLYPILTSADLYLGDNDNDGTPDYKDADNDNDGYADYQEDKASIFDPEFGDAVVYNPLDANSNPGNDDLAIDSDNDGIPDSEDPDKDNDGASNEAEEVAGTNPLLADTDGDGVDDGTEISLNYDPLNKDEKPVTGTQSNLVLDDTFANNSGQVVIGANTNLNNCTVAAGVHLLIAGDANPSFQRCEFNGEYGSPITIENGDSDRDNTEPRLSINDSELKFVIVKNFGQRDLSLGSSTVNNSELYLSERNNGHHWYDIELTDSYVELSNYSYIGSSVIQHSKINSEDGLYISESKAANSYFDFNYLYGNSNTLINTSVIDAVVYDIGKLSNSIYQKTYLGGGSTLIESSDLYGLQSIASDTAYFFDNVAITDWQGAVIDYGFGSPVDTEGDGNANTAVCLSNNDPYMNNCFYVDGIVSPRTTLNFVNGVHDLWDMRNIGTGAIEPGAPSALIEDPVYMQIRVQEGNWLYQDVLIFNADGTVVYQSYKAQVGDEDWIRAPELDAIGYWSVSNGEINVTWTEGEGPWTSVSVDVEDDGSLTINGTATSTTEQAPYSTDDMVEAGYNYYLLNGVTKFQDYTGHWTAIPLDTVAVVYTTDGQLIMPVNVDSGEFSFEGWLTQGQFSANNQTTAYLYKDLNLDGQLDEMNDTHYGDASFNSRQFGTTEAPLAIRNFGEGVTTSDLIGNTYYRIIEENNGSFSMMSSSLQSEGTALYKFYTAKQGDQAWTYLGDDCDELGCIATKDDYLGTWSISSGSINLNIGEDIYSSSYYEGIIMLGHYTTEYYQAAKSSIGHDLAVRKMNSSRLYNSESLENFTLYTEIPLVPINHVGTTKQFSRIGNETFLGENYINMYQPSFEKIIDNDAIEYVTNTFKHISFNQGSTSYISKNGFYSLYNSDKGWHWSSNSNGTNTYASHAVNTAGAIELNNSDETVAKTIWAVDKSDYSSWVIQYDGGYPVIWLRGQPQVNTEGILLPSSNTSALPVENIIGSATDKTWVNHINGNTFNEMTFEVSGNVTIQSITWSDSDNAWLPGDITTTSWDDENGYLTFDLEGVPQKIQILSTNTVAAGVWELNTGNPQVWLTERPTWQ
jgi:hypothetical protein